MKLRLPAFWQAVLVLIGAWLVFSLAVPPFMPRSVMVAYMIIVSVGVILYFSSDEDRWREFKGPIAATLRNDNTWPVRWALVVALPVIPGYLVYDALKPSRETPLELRQVHPSPPASIRVYGKSYDLAKLENPVRMEVLKQL